MRLVVACLVAALVFGPTALAAADHSSSTSPYILVYRFLDRIHCEVASAFASMSDVCRSALNPGSTTRNLRMPKHSQAAIVEVRWESTQAFSKNLAVETFHDLEGSGTAGVEGASVLRLEVPSTTPGGLAAAGALPVDVHAARNSGLVVEQRFEGAVSVFVNLEPPIGYSAFR